MRLPNTTTSSGVRISSTSKQTTLYSVQKYNMVVQVKYASVAPRETGPAARPASVWPFSILRLSRDSYRFSRWWRPFIYLNHHTPSGQSRVYRVTQLHTDGVHCREFTGTGPVVLGGALDVWRARKKVDGVFPGRPQSFRHQHRPEDNKL